MLGDREATREVIWISGQLRGRFAACFQRVAWNGQVERPIALVLRSGLPVGIDPPRFNFHFWGELGSRLGWFHFVRTVIHMRQNTKSNDDV